jgi:ribonuclease P protein component
LIFLPFFGVKLNLMLAKKHRLNLSLAENSQMFNIGGSDRFKSKNLLFYCRKNEDNLRVAALAPSRMFPKAHQRIYYKRLLYNLIKKRIEELKKSNKKDWFKKNIDLIVVYKNKDFEKKNLEDDLNIFFDKYENL